MSHGDEGMTRSELSSSRSYRTLSVLTLVAAVAVASFAPATAQVLDSVSLLQETLSSDFFGTDARAMAMGNTGITTARDGSALIYNPANLARVRRIEFRGSLSHLRVSSDTDFLGEGGTRLTDSQDLNKTRVNSLSLTVPVPTYRGSLVFGFGLQRVNSFDRVFGVKKPLGEQARPYETLSAREIETGGLWKWTAGGAIDISPRLSTGISLHVLTGGDDYRLTREFKGDQAGQTVSKYNKIQIDYVGAAATVGLNYTVSQVITTGLVVESPTYLEAEEFFDIDTSLYIDEELRDRGLLDYSVTRPFSFGFGLTGAFERLTLTTDLHYTDWSQLDIDYDNAAQNETPELLFIVDNLKEVLSWHVGAEYLFPAQGVNLRAGYFLDPLPIDSRFIESQRKFFTIGAGFLLDRVMTVDLAYVHGGHELRDDLLDENPDIVFADQKMRRLFVTFAYRI